jgi:hypothetical protein
MEISPVSCSESEAGCLGYFLFSIPPNIGQASSLTSEARCLGYFLSRNFRHMSFWGAGPVRQPELNGASPFRLVSY